MVSQIPLQNGMFALVDDEDYERCMEHTWTYGNSYGTGYVTYRKYPEYIMLSHFILNNSLSDKKIVMFKNHNSLDFTKKNLKVVNKNEVGFFKRGNKNSSSKYKGVHKAKRGKPWVVNINIDGKTKYLGAYDSEEEAAEVYNEAAKLIQGENAYENKIGSYNNAKPLNDPLKKVANRSKTRTSKYRGVSRSNVRNKWLSYITSTGKQFNLGGFDLEIQAALAYDKKAKELFGDKAILNFPDTFEVDFTEEQAEQFAEIIE